MPLVSILSSAYAPSAKAHISSTIDAVSKLELPDGWDLEWVIQEDGDEPELKPKFQDLRYVKYEANGRQLGLAPTRNLGLSRVRGGIVQLLDHDDILLPRALITLLNAFDNRSTNWAIGQADDLMPNGERIPFPPALPFGAVKAGQVNDWAIEHRGNWPIHCAALMIRTNVLRAIGGWIGIPIDDDLAMFAMLSEVSDGYHEQEVTWLYRQHSTQVHKQDFWQRWSEQGRRVALQRVFALREAKFTLDPTTQIHVGRDLTDLDVGPLHPDKLRHDSRPPELAS